MSTLRDAAPYRAKVQALLVAGATMETIAAATGLTHSAVGYLADGTTRKVRAYTWRALDELTLADCVAVTTGHGPPVGTIRRIQALMTLGWTHREMTARSGVQTRRVVSGSPARVTARTRDAIERLYRDLCMTPGPSPSAARRARAAGHAPPLAWDDIDDPTEQPTGCTNQKDAA